MFIDHFSETVVTQAIKNDSVDVIEIDACIFSRQLSTSAPSPTASVCEKTPHAFPTRTRFVAQIPFRHHSPQQGRRTASPHTKGDNLWRAPVNAVRVSTIEYYSMIDQSPTSQPSLSTGHHCWFIETLCASTRALLAAGPAAKCALEASLWHSEIRVFALPPQAGAANRIGWVRVVAAIKEGENIARSDTKDEVSLTADSKSRRD